MSDGIDYESLSRAFLTLLDRIDTHEGVSAEVHALCRQRFDIAEEHGLTIVFEGEPASAETH